MHIFKASAIVAIGTILSRLTGLLRDHLLARVYGAGDSLDIYYASFRIPDFLYNLLILGTLSAAFIPIFNQELLAGKNGANKLASNIINISLLVMSVFCAILWIITPWLVALLVPGFTAEKLDQTIQATRILLLSPLIFTLSSLVGGILQSYHRFTAAAIAPVGYNLGIIGGVLIAANSAQPGIFSLIWGVLAGACLHLLIQLFSLLKTGFNWHPLLSLYDKASLRVFKLFLPKIFGLDAGQISLLITSFISSYLMPGTLALFSFGSNLQAMPVGVLAISIAIGSFPTLSKHYAASDEAGFFKTLTQGAGLIITLMVPAAIATVLLRTQIVDILLLAGNFTAQDASIVSKSLIFFALSIPFQGLVALLARAFYARGTTLIPVICSGIALLVNILAAVELGKTYGVTGLAFAYSLAVNVNCGLLIVTFVLFCKQQMQGNASAIMSSVKDLVKILLTTIIASLVFGVILHFTKLSLTFFILPGKSLYLIQILFGSLIALTGFLFTLHALNHPLTLELKKRWFKVFFRFK